MTHTSRKFIPLQANAGVYLKEKRVRGRVYPTCVARLLDRRAGAKLLKRLLPGWTREMHLRQAQYHLMREKKLDACWTAVWTNAFKQTFGTPPAMHDYHITAIGREELPEAKKRVLRHCAYSASRHGTLAVAHLSAAGFHQRRTLAEVNELVVNYA